jgi:hypothetical protein
MRNSFFAGAVSLLFVSAGCGPTGNQPDMDMGSTDMAIVMTVPTNFASLNADVLQPSCTFSTCHSPDGMSTANMLDLKDDVGTTTPGSKAYKALVNQPSVNKKALAMGLLRVKQCDATNSFLQIKISLTKDLDKESDFGHHMPQVDGEFLTAAQIQAIKDWINRGALPDEPATVSGSTCQLFKDMGPTTD